MFLMAVKSNKLFGGNIVMDENNNGKKTGFVEAIDNLPLILKILFCIPCLDIIWAIYRIIKGVETGSALLIVVGILWIIPGGMICWIADLITVILSKERPILS